MNTIAQQPDNELIRQVKNGRKESFNMLVRQTVPGLIGFFKYLGVSFQQMDDLVQETYLRAYKSLAGFDEAKPFVSWLLTIGRHVLYDQQKKHKRFHFVPSDRQTGPETPDAGEEVEKRQLVREFLQGLSDEARLLVELRIFQDLPFSEIAQITGEAEGTLRVRFHRVLESMRRLAQKEDGR